MNRTVLLILLLFSSFLYAQREMPLRIELQLAKDAEDYECATIGENGVVIFYETGAISVDSSNFCLMHYDTNFNKIKNYFLPLPVNLRFINYHYADDHLYVLLQELEQKKRASRTYLVDFDINAAEITGKQIDALFDLNIYDFKIVDNHVIIFSTDKKSHRFYIYLPLENYLIQPTFTAEIISTFEFCKPDTFQKQLLWGVSVTGPSKNNVLKLIVTDYKGNLIRDYHYPSYSGYYYSSSRIAVIDSAKAIIIGTYLDERDKYAGNYNTGVYAISFMENQMGDPQFFNYTSIKNKDSTKVGYMKSNKLNVQVLVGPLFYNGNQISLVTELFYPEYTYSSGYTPYDASFYNSSYMPSSATFAGYRYVNAYVTTFDTNGNLIWDYYLPFSNMLTFRLAQRVAVHFMDENAVIFFPYNSYLTSTMIRGYEIIEPLSTIELESKNSKDVVDYSRNPKIENWYGNYFLFSGYQYLKNNSSMPKSKRYVFAMNKLIYR